MINMEQIVAVGRRKTSVARVFLRKGDSKLQINARSLENYFPITRHQNSVQEVLNAIENSGNFTIIVNVKGGGPSGQAGAVCHGIARALAKVGEENFKILRNSNFLTRDSRMVERKKYGQRGARRKFQFSKR